jgi:putative transcriptional regulator
MKDELFQELTESIRDMKAIESGRKKPSRVYKIDKSNPAQAARIRLKLSQEKFAKLLGVSVATLRNWEQGRREPTGAAKVLLRVANEHPEALLAEA